MQKLTSKVSEKIQFKKIWEHTKSLPKNPIFQMVTFVSVAEMLSIRIEMRPLGFTFLALFFHLIISNRFNHLQVQGAEEFEKQLKVWQEQILLFRQTRPAMFCVIASACLGTMAVVGHFVSGALMIHFLLVFTAIISVKYKIDLFKFDKNDFTGWWKGQQKYDFDDEFLPEENESNLLFLEKANDLSSRIEDAEDDESKSDEVPSELLIPDVIPEVNESSTDDEQDDLLPLVPVSKSETLTKNSNKPTDALVKYSHSDDTIEFKKGHFKRDSSISTTSSSSEESLSKGLQFPDHTAVDGPRPVQSANMDISQQEVSRLVSMVGSSQALLAHSSKLIPSLMSGLVQGVLGAGSVGPVQDTSNRRLVTSLDSSDDSDFEILEQEDFQ